ncbi:MAG: hypothetical protein LKI34_08125 [Bifidobacterium tibiigranuli]|uniref:hypothetical protein n=1 Tax=Bifidobacterium tibiigranuli TaxID=2172043 RepID=UPI0026ED9E40|nr:hypothetical protein [Bifidobacterium tibiigranuli]MCI1674164.1 hypothetical protein [Bifidobacterium tibiigranuli]MCI1712475.1 hypothetical protein [Bifidobacterium tibiigranuli]
MSNTASERLTSAGTSSQPPAQHHTFSAAQTALSAPLTQQQLARDPSDILFYIALAMLPVDGTLLGIPLPYWTPLSPWFFLAYALVNWRYLRLTLRAYLPFFLFPVLLVVTSIYGWQTVAVHTNAIALSFVSILLGLSCLASLDIAFARKRLSVRASVTVVVCTYWFAFAVGVAQFIALKLQSDATLHYFAAMMYRRYIRIRPQFLFAEPSYIGMHLFGVLLPLFWLTRDRRLAVLIPVFAAGAIVIGSGTRIIIDSAVALFLWLLSAVNFRNRKATWGFVAGSSAIAAGGLLAVIINPRLNDLATRGVLAGDSSMSARIFHMLAPMWSWKHDPSHFLFGWGAGNISEAVRDGYAGARQWFDAHGGVANSEINGLANPPTNTFTMSAYSSFITEFGIVMFALLVVMLLVHVIKHHAWNRTTVCWLVLTAYLYIQFESYAFYALWLLIFAVSSGCFRASLHNHKTISY